MLQRHLLSAAGGQHPTSGGTYVYGRVQLGPWWGSSPGGAFVTGKTASWAAMALTFPANVAPSHWQRPVALTAVALAAAAGAGSSQWAAPVARFGGAAAAVGALLALVAGCRAHLPCDGAPA